MVQILRGTVPCIVTATSFRGPDGELVRIVEDFKDISERKREEELRVSREKYQTVPEPCVRTPPDLEVVMGGVWGHRSRSCHCQESGR